MLRDLTTGDTAPQLAIAEMSAQLYFQPEASGDSFTKSLGLSHIETLGIHLPFFFLLSCAGRFTGQGQLAATSLDKWVMECKGDVT